MTTPKALAVIIGITEHALPRLRLQTPARDAEDLATLLADRHDYDILLRRDGEATLDQLQKLFEEELPAIVDDSRRILVYFAGHGVAIDSIENPRGYLVPADGGDAIDSLFPMERLSRALDALRCRHLLLVLDCCFAGAFRWSAGRHIVSAQSSSMYRERYELFLATPAWQVITSAAYDEKAADVIAGMAIGQRVDDLARLHSPFFQALYDGLEGDADIFPRTSERQGDGVITATELYLYLRERLEPSHVGPRQTPGLWLLPKHRKGEYIFHVPDRKLRLVNAAPLSRETSPYRGFEVYEAEHAQSFHGRRAATDALLAQVEQQPITVVVGSSGTGKSSLVRAGLIPALRKHHQDWQICGPIRPGSTPLATLDSVLATKRGGSVVLVIDQLEELFAMPERSNEHRQFLERLVELTGIGSIRVVGTLRADLETELWASPLGKLWQHARFPLADMTREELRDAIERPAEDMVLTFDPPEMVDRLINTVVSMPGALPLLSFTLDKLYLDCIARATGDRRLVEINPHDAGGVALALRDHADAVYEQFDAPTQETMRRILLRMVAIKGSRATRRQVPLDELEFTDPAENHRVRTVLNALTGNASPADDTNTIPAPASLRIAVLGGDHHTPRFVELAHDAVVHDWPRLNEWRLAAQEDLAIHHAVTAATSEWVRSGKHVGMLWVDDPRLPLARTLLMAEMAPVDGGRRPVAAHRLNHLEAEFIRRSHRTRIRRRALLWGIPAVLGPLLYLRMQSERAANERAEDSALADQGSRVSAQAHVPGQEQEALIAVVEALGRAMRMGRPIPATILRGAVEASGYRRVDLPSQRSRVLSLACSPNGSMVVTSGADGSVVIHSHGHTFALSANSRVANGLAFTPDGSAIITGSRDGHVVRWTIAPNTDSYTVAEQQQEIEAITTSPDGQSVATAGKDGKVRLWSLVHPETPPVNFDGFTDIVTDVVFARNGNRIAASSRDGTSRVWSIPEHSLVFATKPEIVTDYTLSITSVDFSADGSRLTTGGMRTIIWDLESGKKISVLKDTQALSARFSPDGSELITGSRDGAIVRWDARSLRKIDVAIKGDSAPAVMKYCGNSRRVAIADDSGRLYIHDFGRDNASMILGSRKHPIMAVAFDQDDRTVFAGTSGLERWDVRSGGRIASGLDGEANVWALALSSDGTVLRVETRDGKLMAWDTARNISNTLPTARAFDGGRILAAVVAKQRQRLPNIYLETSTDDRYAGLVGKYEKRSRTASKALEQNMSLDGAAPTSKPSNAVSFSPRGDLVVTTGLDGTVEILDVATGRNVAQMFGHVGAVRSAVFSPDGRTVATTGDDGTARLWDAATGAALAVFTGHEGPVLSATFSHNGELLATAGFDGTVRIYPVRAAGIFALACSRLRETLAWSRVSALCPPD